jgi:hypothetical protein
MQGFLLGLANGTSCLTFCAPVLIPYLLGEGQNVGQNLKFLGGRLGGYLLFGSLAWLAGRLIAGIADYQSLLYGAAYVGFSVLLLVSVLARPHKHTGCAIPNARARLARWPAPINFASGRYCCSACRCCSFRR